jgi:hypothetical protein
MAIKSPFHKLDLRDQPGRNWSSPSARLASSHRRQGTSADYNYSVTATMECPKCKLISPKSATKCDCGFRFQSGGLDEPVQSAGDSLTVAPPTHKAPFLANLGLVAAWGVVLGGAVVLLLSLLLKYWGF